MSLIQGIKGTVPTIASSAIGASVWWTMRSVGIATFSPVGVGLGIGAYAIVKPYAYSFFTKIFNLLSNSENVSDRTGVLIHNFTSLSSLAVALIPIYYLGVTTLFTFTPIIETLLFIKGIDILTYFTPELINRLEETFDGKLDASYQFIAERYHALSDKYAAWRHSTPAADANVNYELEADGDALTNSDKPTDRDSYN
jgi:hypothetical protein